MNQEEYEAIKAQVLQEQRAEQRAKAKERERINHESWHMFDVTKSKYLPLLVEKHAKRTGNYNCVSVYEGKIQDAINATLGLIHERNRKTAYLNGRAEEANQVLQRLLEQMLNN